MRSKVDVLGEGEPPQASPAGKKNDQKKKRKNVKYLSQRKKRKTEAEQQERKKMICLRDYAIPKRMAS